MKWIYLFSLLLLLPVITIAQDYEFEVLGRWEAEGLRDRKGQIYNEIWGWSSGKGREYAIIGSLDSTHFVEVTDPRNPIVRDVEAGRDTLCIHRDYKTWKHYCFAVADEGKSSIQVFDMSYLPDSVHKVYDSDSLSIRSHNVFVEGDFLYIANNLHKKWGDIPMSVARIKEGGGDLSFVTHLQKLVIGGEEYFKNVHDVFVRDGIAFCSNGFGGLYIYDVTNLEENGIQLRSFLRDYPNPGYNHSSWLSEDNKYLVFADETHGLELKIYDVVDLDNPQYLGSFGSNASRGSIAHNPFIAGNICFVSYYHEGLVAFDISDPLNVEKVAQYDTYPDNSDTTWEGYEGCWGVYPYLPSGNIIVSDMKYGLFVMSLDNWDSPYKENPQPAKAQLSHTLNQNDVIINLGSYYEGEVSYTIFDLKGSLQSTYKEEHAGFNYRIDIDELAQGMYLMNFAIGNESYHVKFFKYRD